MDGVTTESTKETTARAQDQEEQWLADLKAEAQMSTDAFNDQRAREVADLRFEAGEHWNAEALAERKLKNKPAMVMNQLSGYIQQVNNEPVQRIVVTAQKGADPLMAELWQGICRRIENLSNAEDVYKWARAHVLKMGRGFWRVRADVFSAFEPTPDGQYDPSVFNQDIRIEPIKHQHSVYEDPRCRMLDHSDMRFCLIGEDLEWKEFARLYPKAEHVTAEAVRATGDCPPDWATEKHCRVMERYWIEDETVTLCALVDGRIVVKGQGPAYPKEQIQREHTFRIPRVKWMKATGAERLDGPVDVPGRYIPVVKIVGEMRVIEGKTDTSGMTRMMKDPQRVADYGESRLWQAVDNATLSVWLTPEEAIAGFPEWDALESGGNPARLRYKTVDMNHPDGERLPPPNHVTTAPAIAPLVAALQRATMMMRHIAGAPDVAPEETRPEVSGIAIGRRDAQRKQSTSHFADATKAGIRLTGRIILSAARQIYDVPQVLQIKGTADEDITVIPHKGDAQLPAAQALAQQQQARPVIDEQTKAAVVRLLDISVADFDVDVTAGKGFQTGRQEAVEALQTIVQAAPNTAPVVIPTLLENMDFPGAAKVAKLLQPPDPNSNTVPIEEAQKAQQVIDALTAKVTELQQQQQAKQLELQNEAQISSEDNQTKLQIEAMKIQAQRDLAQMTGIIELQKAEIEAKRDIEVAKVQPKPEPVGQGGVSFEGSY